MELKKKKTIWVLFSPVYPWFFLKKLLENFLFIQKWIIWFISWLSCVPLDFVNIPWTVLQFYHLNLHLGWAKEGRGICSHCFHMLMYGLASVSPTLWNVWTNFSTTKNNKKDPLTFAGDISTSQRLSDFHLGFEMLKSFTEVSELVHKYIQHNSPFKWKFS